MVRNVVVRMTMDIDKFSPSNGCSPTAMSKAPFDHMDNSPSRLLSFTPSITLCSRRRCVSRVVCAGFGRTRHRNIVRGIVVHSCCGRGFPRGNLGMAALTILTDFCLSVSEGDGVTGVVMFAPSKQDPNLSGRYSLSELDVSVHDARASQP